MMPQPPRTYNEHVAMVWRRGASLLLLVFLFALGTARDALAQPVQISVAQNPILIVQLRSGSVMIHTWDRDQIAVDADPQIQVRHFSAEQVASRLPQQVMLWSESVTTPDGETMTLPGEPFVLPPLTGSTHDAVIARGEGNVTVTIPASTALVIANVTQQGGVSIQGYRNGVFVSHVRRGNVQLQNVGGVGAVQVVNGPVSISNSTFDRLRVRTARGNMTFENCVARQIEVTSLTGSILYDNGSFQPGLARFETQRGDVALGVTGGDVQIGAHSSAGRIQSAFGRDVNVSRTANDAQAFVGHGGPVVTASSDRGAVVIYPGTWRKHPQLRNRVQQRFTRPPPRGRRRPPYGIPRA